MDICGGFDLSCRHFFLSFIRIRPSNMQLDSLAFWIFERVGKGGGIYATEADMSKSPPSCLSVGRLLWTQITSMVDGQPIVFPPLSHLTGCNYEVRQSLRSYIVNPAGLSFPRPLLLHGNIHVTHKGGQTPLPPDRYDDWTAAATGPNVSGAPIRLWACLGLERSSNRRLVDRYLSWSHISS